MRGRWPVDPPGFDNAPRHRQAPKQMLVEAFIAEAAVEAFHEGILDRFAWRDAVPLDIGVLLAALDGMRGQLSAIVADDQSGLPRALMSASSSRTTRWLDSEVSTTTHGLKSSTTARTRNAPQRLERRSLAAYRSSAEVAW